MAQNIGANTSPNTPILFCKNKLACKVSIFFIFSTVFVVLFYDLEPSNVIIAA